jgi:hypothetical protein
VFSDPVLKEIKFPNSVRFITALSFDQQILQSVFFDYSPTNFMVRCEMVEDISTKTLISYLGSGVSLVIGKSVETIGYSCFERNKTFGNIAFEPGSVLQQIGESAFGTTQGN